MADYKQTFDALFDDSRIELLTRLDNSSKVRLDVIVARKLIEANYSARLFNLLREDELIAYRTVREFNDVYSFKTRTISIHPSTYRFLVDHGVEKILTYAKDKKTMTFVKLVSFTSILDLGIGPLRRAHIDACESFASFSPIDVRDFKIEQQITTPIVFDDLLREAKRPVRRDEQRDDDQSGRLF